MNISSLSGGAPLGPIARSITPFVTSEGELPAAAAPAKGGVTLSGALAGEGGLPGSDKPPSKADLDALDNFETAELNRGEAEAGKAALADMQAQQAEYHAALADHKEQVADYKDGYMAYQDQYDAYKAHYEDYKKQYDDYKAKYPDADVAPPAPLVDRIAYVPPAE